MRAQKKVQIDNSFHFSFLLSTSGFMYFRILATVNISPIEYTRGKLSILQILKEKDVIYIYVVNFFNERFAQRQAYYTTQVFNI